MPSSPSASHAIAKRPEPTPVTSTSTALNKRSSSSALMPPPPPPKRIKRPAQILDEDAYTDSLSRIIARDFFPGLAETEAQHEFLDAQASKDPAWIQSAGDRLAATMTPRVRGRRGTNMGTENLSEELVRTVGLTPKYWAGDTPPTESAGQERDAAEMDQRKKVDTNMSLSAFQSKYTSEDNESFNKLLDEQNERRRDKYRWLWNGNKIPSARQIIWNKRDEKLETKKSEQESEDGKALLAIEGSDMRKAMPNTWKSRPDNNLMFGPDSIEDDEPTLQHKAEKASRAGPKAVVYANTRMPLAPELENATAIPASPSLSAINDAIAGRPRHSGLTSSGQSGDETPRVNGYAFVDPEASPEPPSPSQADWSKFSLGPGDAAPNPFKIQEQSSREDLHHRMVDKVAKSKRTQQLSVQSNSPVPRFMSSPRPTKSGLTPAGQRLLGSVGGKTPGGSIWETAGTPLVRSNLGRGWTPKAKTTRN